MIFPPALLSPFLLQFTLSPLVLSFSFFVVGHVVLVSSCSLLSLSLSPASTVGIDEWNHVSPRGPHILLHRTEGGQEDLCAVSWLAGGLRMAISSWVGSGPQAYLMEVGLQNPAWREVTLAVAYGPSLVFLLYSGPQSAFPLALSPPGLPGITSGLNDSLHPTVYVSVFCFSHGYLTHWLSHGLLRLPQHAPSSLCDCPSSSVSFQDFRVPV